MSKLFKNKKVCIALIVICILVLAGIIIGVAMKGDKDETQTGKDGSEQEIIVHESDKDTVEEEVEGGLKESDSEDGPVLDEDKMIDFNGSDAKTDNKTESNKSENTSSGSKPNGDESAGNNNAGDESGDGVGNGGEDDNTDDSTAEKPKEESKDTGSWGAFY